MHVNDIAADPTIDVALHSESSALATHAAVA
jgi:hypothetical protein